MVGDGGLDGGAAGAGEDGERAEGWWGKWGKWGGGEERGVVVEWAVEAGKECQGVDEWVPMNKRGFGNRRDFAVWSLGG